jgi:hypothetical protein
MSGRLAPRRIMRGLERRVPQRSFRPLLPHGLLAPAVTEYGPESLQPELTEAGLAVREPSARWGELRAVARPAAGES